MPLSYWLTTTFLQDSYTFVKISIIKCHSHHQLTLQCHSQHSCWHMSLFRLDGVCASKFHREECAIYIIYLSSARSRVAFFMLSLSACPYQTACSIRSIMVPSLLCTFVAHIIFSCFLSISLYFSLSLSPSPSFSPSLPPSLPPSLSLSPFLSIYVSLWLQDTCHIKQHSAYAWVVTCILFLINLTFHNLSLHSWYKIHQPFTDYYLRLPYSELLEKPSFLLSGQPSSSWPFSIANQALATIANQATIFSLSLQFSIANHAPSPSFWNANWALSTVLCAFCRRLPQIEPHNRGNRDPPSATGATCPRTFSPVNSRVP